MDVYVIPLGLDRYELYCEQPFSADPPTDGGQPGLFGRVRERFEDLLRRAERWQTPEETAAPPGLLGRLHHRTMAWVAERVVEQRLLWNLRRESAVVADYPDDLTFDQAHAVVFRILRRD